MSQELTAPLDNRAASQRRWSRVALKIAQGSAVVVGGAALLLGLKHEVGLNLPPSDKVLIIIGLGGCAVGMGGRIGEQAFRDGARSNEITAADLVPLGHSTPVGVYPMAEASSSNIPTSDQE